MKTIVLLLHGSGGTGMQLRTFLETAPINSLGQRTFREILDTGLSCESGKRTGPISLVTPTSDVMPYTPLGGETLNVWFDRSPQFLSRGMEDREDLIGADRSIDKLFPIISELDRNFDNIFIGGFSMGGGLALHFLRRKISAKIKGIFSMGSFLVNSSAVTASPLPPHALKIPVLLMHGDHDSLIPVDFGRKTASNLVLQNVNVQFREYKNVDHEIAPDELRDILYWMEDILSTERKKEEEEEEEKGCDAKTGDDDGVQDRNIDGAKQQGYATASTSNSTTTVSPLTYLAAESEGSADLTSSSKHSNSNSNSGHPKDCLPYWFESPDSTSSFIIHFQTPPDSIELLCARAVMACGAEFKIIPDGELAVKVFAYTSDPHKTAFEVGKRLFFRLGQGDVANMNPCPMS